MDFIRILEKLIFCVVFMLICISCREQNYTLLVDYPFTGKILINDKSIEHWLTRKPVIMDKKTTLYFLNLEHKRYNLRLELHDGSIIDTSFIVESGESYYGIDMITGELYGFK